MVGHKSTEEESSEMGRNMMVFIPVCFLLVNGKIFTSAPLRILALSTAFNFILGIAAAFVDLEEEVPER